MVSYGSGAPGGIFAPMLVLGATLGVLVGLAASVFAPGLVPIPTAYVVIGMAALFTASVRVPLTGIILIVEMTGSFEPVFAVGVARLAAYLIAERLGDRPIYEALLEDDLHRSGSMPAEDREPRLVDVVVEPHSHMDRIRVRELGLPPGCLLVSVRRGGQEFVP